jgi:hypothetical protein
MALPFINSIMGVTLIYLEPDNQKLPSRGLGGLFYQVTDGINDSFGVFGSFNYQVDDLYSK